jgi:hypothetical protein
MRFRVFRPLVLAAIIALLLVGCNEDDETTSQEDEPFTGSPTALAARPADAEQANLIIEGGQFDTDGVELQEDESTIFLISNEDNVDYVFRIEELVADTPIPAGEQTTIEFTQPNEGTFEAQLTAEGGGDPLDTLVIEVAPPEGSAP